MATWKTSQGAGAPTIERLIGIALRIGILAISISDCGDRSTSPHVSATEANFSSANQSYSIAPLEAPARADANAYAIDEVGDIAGFATSPNGGAALWIGGVYHDLGGLGGESVARGINSRGDVVGVADVPGGHSQKHAVLWTGGAIIDLGTLGGVSSDAWAINARGQVIGWANTASGDQHAFLWENGAMTDLGVPGVSSIGTAINDAGIIVGFSGEGGNTHWAMWDRGQFTDLGLSGIARGINNAGDVVGESVVSFPGGGAGNHAFLLRNGVATDLGGLEPSRESQALGITARGQIVGGGYTSGGLSFHAFVWTDGSMTDLGTLSGLVSEADAINNSGKIAGVSSSSPNSFRPSAARRLESLNLRG